MNTKQHLAAIVAKCKANVKYAETNVSDYYGGRAIAGWKATIAAIERLQAMANDEWCQHSGDSKTALNLILAAWPEHLL